MTVKLKWLAVNITHDGELVRLHLDIEQYRAAQCAMLLKELGYAEVQIELLNSNVLEYRLSRELERADIIKAQLDEKIRQVTNALNDKDDYYTDDIGLCNLCDDPFCNGYHPG